MAALGRYRTPRLAGEASCYIRMCNAEGPILVPNPATPTEAAHWGNPLFQVIPNCLRQLSEMKIRASMVQFRPLAPSNQLNALHRVPARTVGAPSLEGFSL